MRITGISIAVVLSLALFGCQGDDNTLPSPVDAGAGDAKVEASAPHDGSSDGAEAGKDAEAIDATEDIALASDAAEDIAPASDGRAGDGDADQ